jgi:hypothetical protein
MKNIIPRGGGGGGGLTYLTWTQGLSVLSECALPTWPRRLLESVLFNYKVIIQITYDAKFGIVVGAA